MMKQKKSVAMLILSIISLILPVPFAALMTLFEPEINEAIAAGVILGWGIGGIISAVLMIINKKQKNSLCVALNAISMVGIVVLAFSFLMSFYY